MASARIAIEPTLGAALDRVRDTESTPPLWYALAWGVEQAGLPVEAARGLGVAAGALLAGLLVAYARRLLPLWAAGLAGVVVALGSQLVLRGSELRAYGLYALLALLAAWLLERAAWSPSRGRLAALALATAAGLLTHYFFLLVLLTGIAWLWTSPSLQPARGRVLGAIAAGLLPFLAWVPFLWQQVENGRFSWIGDFSPLNAAAVYSTFVWNAGPLYVRELVDLGPLETILRIAALVVVAGGCAAAWRLGPRGRLAALLALGPVALAALLWLAGENLFTARNLLASAPFAAVAAAALAAALPRRLGPVAGTALLAVVVAGLARERELAPPAYDEVADALVELGWERGDSVAIVGQAHELTYLGTPFAIRGPVSWYLPGHPRLVVASDEPCRQAFAIARPAQDAGLLEEARDSVTVEEITVARIPCADDLAERIEADDGFVFVSRGP